MTGIDHAPALHPGDEGEWVLYLQQLLETAGYSPGQVNHRYGPGTAAAVKHYQDSVRSFKGADYITEHDHVGPQTWHALYTSAHIHEDLQDADQTLSHDHERHADKLDAGRQVGRENWKRGTLQCTVKDFHGNEHNGQDNFMTFDVQQAYVEHKLTTHEAEQHGYTEEGKVSAGLDIEIVSIGGEVSYGNSTLHSHGADEELTVRIAQPHLTMTQTG